jgi:translation initiation factor SUI1
MDTNNVHIRVQQRNRSKCITTISGMSRELDIDKIARFLKVRLNTHGAVKEVAELNNEKIIQLAGDHRVSIRDFFIESEIYNSDQIVIHGG